MAFDFQSNPWTLNAADVPAQLTISAGGIVQVSPLTPGAVKITFTGAHGLLAGQFITVFGNSAGRFGGWYKVIAVIDTTHILCANLSSPSSGRPFSTTLAADGGGTVILNQWQSNIRAEDISWQSPTTLTSDTLVLRDRNGVTKWSASAGATAITGNAQNRGKMMWFNGLSVDTISSGSVYVTVN